MTREELDKPFFIGETEYNITRTDYEGLPIPMVARFFSDEEMEQLAHAISCFFVPVGDENKDAELFWKEMESCAVHMGMMYYEDLYEKWLEAFQELPVYEQIIIYNQVVSSTEEIHSMDDFDYIVRDEWEFTPSDVLMRTYYNSENINPHDEWWKITEHGNFQTMDDDSVLDKIEPYYELIFDNEEYWQDVINPKKL